MKRRRRKPMKWHQPRYFQRRTAARLLRTFRGEMIRGSLYMLVGLVLLHATFIHFRLTLAVSLGWMYLYVLFIPSIFLVPISIGCISSSAVIIRARFVYTNFGGQGMQYKYSTIKRFRIGSIAVHPDLAYLAIARKGKRTVFVGIPRTVDLIKLDRQLRARCRFWNRREQLK